MGADIGGVAAELYGLRPGEFTARRNASAKAARSDGNRELAEAIKQLRRPTTSAWLANLVVRRRPEQLSELLELGARLVEAQAQLEADELRRLSKQRHQVVAALGRAARQLGREAGEDVSDAAGRELESTLDAALADPAAAEALQSGCLTTALRYSGLGSVNLESAVAVPAPRDAVDDGTPPAPVPTDDLDAPRRRRQAVDAAVQLLQDAQAAADRGQQVLEEHERRVQAACGPSAQDRLERRRRQILALDEQIAALVAEERQAAEDGRRATTERDLAEATWRAAQDEVVRAQERLDRLRT